MTVVRRETRRLYKWLEFFVYHIIRACNMYINLNSKLTSANSNSKDLKNQIENGSCSNEKKINSDW